MTNEELIKCLPEGTYWGDTVTGDMVRHILSYAAAQQEKRIAELEKALRAALNTLQGLEVPPTAP